MTLQNNKILHDNYNTTCVLLCELTSVFSVWVTIYPSSAGVYPLFKRNVPNLQGAAVRVHLSLSSAYHPSVTAHCTSSAEDQSLSEEEAAQDTSADDDRRQEDRIECKKSSPRSEGPSAVPDSQPVCVDVENTFAVNIVVERAMHLSLKGM